MGKGGKRRGRKAAPRGPSRGAASGGPEDAARGAVSGGSEGASRRAGAGDRAGRPQGAESGGGAGAPQAAGGEPSGASHVPATGDPRGTPADPSTASHGPAAADPSTASRGAAAGREARLAALALIGGVRDEGRALAEAAGSEDPAVRARALRLAGQVLRHQARADRVLRPHLRRAPPPSVADVLRLATVEMLAEGAAPHGAVNAAVGLLRAEPRLAPYAGLANAVLRRVAEGGAADWAAAPAQPLPKWLRGRLISAWGSDAVAAMERAHEAGAPVDLTLRRAVAADPGDPAEGDASPAGWAARLGAELLPTGSLRLRAPGQISALPGYAEGAWWVQDAAAALPVRGLGLAPGETALDLCAAPGGKTLQMAARGAAVTALDISGARLGRLRDNLARMRLEAEVVVADALAWDPGRSFDAILLDAPCTATGTIRRHPDLPFVRRREDVAALAALQSALLDRAIPWLASGGRLVFCTCSLLPEEGERQVAAALSRHPGLHVDAAAFDLPGVDPAWRSAEGGLRLRPDFWPDRGGIDGFYMACLRRG